MKLNLKLLLIAIMCATASLRVSAADDVEQLREDLKELRRHYDERIRDLEQRLNAAEAAARQANKAVDATPAVSDHVHPGGRGQVTNNAFNPAISAVVQAGVSTYSQDPGEAAIPGFPAGGESALPPEGFSLSETEITVSANVDTLFYGEMTIGMHEDEDGTEVDIEEAFFDTLSLPGGLGLRGGRFYSGIGYLNKFHTHAWDFRDAPLPYRVFLGGQYGDDGLRLNWLAPTELYVSVGLELLQGDHYPGGHSSADLGDVRSTFIKIGDDLDVSNSWQMGLSALQVDAVERGSDSHGHGNSESGSLFTGDSDLWIADFVWKWAPGGNPVHRNFKLVAELFYREEHGDINFTEGDMAASLPYDGEQRGAYLAGIYQFRPRWRVGLRYDWLDSDNQISLLDTGGLPPDEVLEETGLLDADDDPTRWSLMTDWSPSEFSRVRLQYNRDETRARETDHQWFLQYIMSLGAHSAHEY